MLFDVMSPKAFDARSEAASYGHRFMGGFWAEGDYFTFLNTFKYDVEKVILDQYTIIEADRVWQIFNWMQYFGRSDIIDELAQNGFETIEIVGDVINSPGNDDETYFYVIAKPTS